MFDALRDRVRRPRREETLPDPASSLLDDDPALDLLAQELGELGGVELFAAPRERTLARLRTEVRAQKARGAFSGSPRRAVSRVALGGAALALLVGATLGMFALTDGGGDQDQIAGGSSTTDAHVVATTADTQSPGTTGSSVPATVTTEAPVTTVTTVPTTTPSTSHTATTADHPTPTSPPASVRPRTTTTDEPDTTTTTGDAVMTWEDREDSARTVVLSLGERSASGDLAGVDTYVDSSAQSRSRPHDQLVGAALRSPYRVRHRDLHGRPGAPRDDRQRGRRAERPDRGRTAVFGFDTRTDTDGARITAIYAAPPR